MAISKGDGLLGAALRALGRGGPEHVARVLSELSEADKLVATLVLVEGLEPEEVAAQLGISEEDLAARLGDIMRKVAGEELGHLASWTAVAIHAECRPTYRDYNRALEEHYTAVLAHEGVAEDRWIAKDTASTLPDGMDFLVERLADKPLHDKHRSAKSSQMLALGLLGATQDHDPEFRALTEALAPAPPLGTLTPHVEFEFQVSPELLNEHPRQTAVDLLLEGPQAVYLIEAKWTEQGMGTCSCPTPRLGRDCSQRVRERPLYWETASELFHLPDASPEAPCPVSPGYQAIRNVAAASALAGPERDAVFVLVYDEHNPYFGGAADWPGWPAVLAHTLADTDRVTFKSISWQTLAPELPLDDNVKRWARERHQLDV